MGCAAPCNNQQSNANFPSHESQFLGAAAQHMDDPMSPTENRQEHFKSQDCFSVAQPFKQVQSRPSQPEFTFTPTSPDAARDSMLTNSALASFTPSSNSPEPACKIPSVSSHDDVGDVLEWELDDLDFVHLYTPRFWTPGSDPDFCIVDPQSAADNAYQGTNTQFASDTVNPLPGQKSMDTSLSLTLRQSRSSRSSPASEDGSASSDRSNVLQIPRQNVQKVKKKRRKLDDAGRKNAQMVRKVGACVRCRMFKLKVKYYSGPSLLNGLPYSIYIN